MKAGYVKRGLAIAVLLMCLVVLPGQAVADVDQKLSISGPASAVGEGGTATFTISLTAGTDPSATVKYETKDGTATVGEDYEERTTTETVPAGGSVTVDVPIKEDARHEATESFTMELSDADGATIDAASATATIADNDSAPVVSITDAAAVTEGVGPATFSVSISGTSSSPVTVTYATENGSAVAPGDYTHTQAPLVWAPGDTSARTIQVPVADDDVPEATETFRVRLTSASGGSIGGSGFGTGTIRDNDQPTATIGNAIDSPGPDAGVAEGRDAVFPVTLSRASTIPVRISYRTVDGSASAGQDFEGRAPGSAVEIPAGQTAGSITVPTINDAAAEGNETFKVVLGDPNETVRIGTPSEGTATILDNEPGSTISVLGAEVVEGNGGTVTLDFTVKLSATIARQVEVTALTTGEGTANASDYRPKTERFVWTANTTELVKTFSVVVVGDALDEPNETLAVTLTDPVGATIDVVGAIGTIRDNDNTSMLSIADAEANEGGAGVSSTMTFKVTLAPASARTVSLSYATANGTAASGSDYTEASGSLVFAPGETDKTVSVTVLGDDVTEDNETVLVRLTGAAGGKVADAEAQGTIIDKNAPPSLSISDTIAREGGGASFTVQLAGNTLRAVTVGFSTGDGTAKEPGDYSARRGALTFAPGEKTKTIDVSVVDDTLPEPVESFSVNLGDPVNATMTKSRGTATIEASDQVTPTSIPPQTSPRPTRRAAPKTVLPKMVLAPRIVNVTTKGLARLFLTCAKASPITCRGSVTLQTTGKPAVKIGSKPFSVKKGKRQTLGVKLSPKARKLLAQHPTLRARVVVLVKTGKRSLRVVPGVITLKAAPKPATPKSTPRQAP